MADTPKNWNDIDELREEAAMTKAELARAAGIPEATIYKGLKSNARLQPGTLRIVLEALGVDQAA